MKPIPQIIAVVVPGYSVHWSLLKLFTCFYQVVVRPTEGGLETLGERRVISNMIGGVAADEEKGTARKSFRPLIRPIERGVLRTI